MIILEIIGAILSVYYSNNVSSATEQSYRSGWTRALEQYNTNPEAMRVVDVFQTRVGIVYQLFLFPPHLIV